MRRGGEGDRAYVLDLGRRVACDSVSSLRPGIPALVELAYEKLVDFVMGQSHAILIASNGERDLGFLLFLDSLPDEVSLSPQGFIAYMAVEPQARRHGVGSALLREAETVARERGLAFIAMMVTEENRAARELYDRFGFQTERRLLCKAV
ncbi:MAG: GNAT family N-acetyltransferase [Candidatus Eremiobacteraeota bacterium]|nr:GNAT family N-acetyltransferase [Candidatus Eremiobacteraeota bacterium]MBV8354755.1 GNAT family N-acetyltransferase [Candidatus Eremiobacteraeota bacterium]